MDFVGRRVRPVGFELVVVAAVLCARTFVDVGDELASRVETIERERHRGAGIVTGDIGCTGGCVEAVGAAVEQLEFNRCQVSPVDLGGRGGVRVTHHGAHARNLGDQIVTVVVTGMIVLFFVLRLGG